MIVKIRLGSGLWFLILLAIALVLIILFIPNTGIRAILGLPFILFTPGYALITALFPRRSSIDTIERIALSIGLSFAVVALLGLALNYTSWGITLWSSIIASGGFVVIMTVIAEIRRRSFSPEERFSVNIDLSKISLGENTFSRVLSIILIITILGTVGTLIYTVSNPKVGEKFTEFYIIGLNGQAADYPQNFTMSDGVVKSVDYGDGNIIKEDRARMTIGIINRQQEQMTYQIQLYINDELIEIYHNSSLVDSIDSITLQNDEEYETEIGFAPVAPGDNQRVDIVLLVNGEPYFDDPLHIWINVSTE
jgi:uncharacterized membrane protein